MAASDETPVPSRTAQRGAATPRWFGDLGQAEFEEEFYERILARHPNYVFVLRALGESLSRYRLYARSIEVHRRLVILVPHDCVAHSKLACGLARQAATREAIQELGRASTSGTTISGIWIVILTWTACGSCRPIGIGCGNTRFKAG